MSESEPIPSTSSSSNPASTSAARLLRVIPAAASCSTFTKEPHLKEVRLDPSATSSPSWTIGRHPLAEVTVENVNVSRRHAIVRFEAERDRWTVSDLKSLNGVHVNGSDIGREAEAEIAHGDTVSLGPLEDYKWTFVVVSGKVGRGKIKRAGDEGGEPEIGEPLPKKAKEAAELSAGTTQKDGERPEPKEEAAEYVEIQESKEEHVEGGKAKISNEQRDKERADVKDEATKAYAEQKTDLQSKKSDGASSGERLRDRFAAELCCPVCSEVFINPTTLVGCGHVFCSLCIAKWRKKKRSDALFCCPTCRVSIKR